MYILDVLNTLKSWDSFLKHVKENDKKKKEAKEKGSWIQLKHQPVSARETHFVKTNGKESEPLKYISYEFMVWKVQEKWTKGLWTVPLKWLIVYSLYFNKAIIKSIYTHTLYTYA